MQLLFSEKPLRQSCGNLSHSFCLKQSRPLFLTNAIEILKTRESAAGVVYSAPVVNSFFIKIMTNHTRDLFTTAVCQPEGIPYISRSPVSNISHFSAGSFQETASSSF